MGVAALDGVGRHPLRVRINGTVATLPDPRALTYAEISQHIEAGGRFLLDSRTPLWKSNLLLERWLAHHGLGDARDVRRLGFLVDRYEAQLVFDLQRFAGVDLEAEWRARRFRRLLQLIDHLPGHSHYHSAVSNDPEHAQMIADAAVQQKDDGEFRGDPVTSWTPEVSMSAEILDAVKGLQHTLIMVNHDGKGAKPTPPKPRKRPETVLSRLSVGAGHKARQARHEELVGRLLPHKRGS